MTVKELIDELQTYPQDMEVCVPEPNGDYIRLNPNEHLDIVLESVVIGVL